MKGTAALGDRVNILAFFVVLTLAAASLIFQTNAEHYAGGDFRERQTIWVVVGGCLFFFAAVVDLRLVERASYAVFGICLILLILTATIGTEVNHSKRWIDLGFFNIQASEFTKLAVVLGLARFLHTNKERTPGGDDGHVGRYELKDLVKPLAVFGAPLPLILFQPDLGTTLLIVFVILTMLIMEGMRRRSIMIAVAIFMVVIPVAWKSGLIRDYQKNRVRLLVNMDWEKVDDATGVVHKKRTTQGEQAKWAVSSGGLVGAGLQGASKPRLRVLPEIHTDFIAAMVAEEVGFVGFTAILLLFWLIVMWALRSAQDSRTRYCRLICIGIGAMIGWQVFINVGMVTGLLPVVGLPLPFLSYGGSAMLTMLAALGLVFNVALRRGRL